jgi:uncharacterized membrane protein YqaE (UPF0057 family)
MKKLSFFLVVAFMSTLILDSCTVQKRYHRKGFNVNWNHTSIGGKNDKIKASNETVEEEIVEINESKAIEKKIKNEVPTYSNEEVSDLSSTNEEISISISFPDENKLNSNKSLETKNKNNSTFNSQKKSIKKNLESRNIQSFESNETSSKTIDTLTLILIILCFILPPLAVAIATDLDLKPILWNLVWCILGVLPGIIHALIHVSRNR